MTVEHLPERAGNLFLWCERCGNEYSATRGDYFWMTPDQEFECCGDTLLLASKHTHYVVA